MYCEQRPAPDLGSVPPPPSPAFVLWLPNGGSCFLLPIALNYTGKGAALDLWVAADDNASLPPTPALRRSLLQLTMQICMFGSVNLTQCVKESQAPASQSPSRQKRRPAPSPGSGGGEWAMQTGAGPGGGPSAAPSLRKLTGQAETDLAWLEGHTRRAQARSWTHSPPPVFGGGASLLLRERTLLTCESWLLLCSLGSSPPHTHNSVASAPPPSRAVVCLR